MQFETLKEIQDRIGQQVGHRLGTLLWWSLNGNRIEHDKLEELARQHGLDEKFLPTPIKPAGAFRRELLVRFDVLTKAKKPALQQLYTTRSSKDHQRILGIIADVHRAVEHKPFHVNPGWQCKSCEFKKICDSEA